MQSPTETTNVLTISPSLSPEYLHIENGPAEWTVHAIARFSDLKDAYSALSDAKADIMADTTLTEDARLVRIAALYEKAVAPRAVAAQAAIDDLDTYVAGIIGAHQAAVAPSTKPAGMALESEIRAALRSMSEKDRAAAVSMAVQSGNRDVMAALNGPSFLHGVEPDRVANYQADYVNRHHPELKAATDAVRTLTARATQSKAALRELYDTVFTPREKHQLRQAIAVSERANRHLK